MPHEFYHKSECLPTEALKALHKEWAPTTPFADWLEVRDQCRKDLFFLGKNILGKNLQEHVHRAVCDFFVQKNFDGCYWEGYTVDDVHAAFAAQDPEKERMLLDPRGSYKSTLDGIDCVQWLLNAPDCRIFIITGEYELAVAFLKEVKGYFFLPTDAEPSNFQWLFPEYILRGVDGTSTQPLICPARKHDQKDPSLWVNAITANLSGWHCDVKKSDDIVTNRNSNTVEARIKLKDNFDNVSKLLDQWGYEDGIGTRYAPDDLYGTRLTAVSPEFPLKYFCRSAWTVKPEFQSLALRDLKEHMVDLLFPEKLNWKWLRKELLRNERDFRCQLLNDPVGTTSVTFSDDVLRAHICQPSKAPATGDVFIAWDWAATSSDKSDGSCGVAARIDPVNNALYILEIVHGRFKQSELAYQIVAFAKKYAPRQIIIERSVGAELLQMEVQRQAVQFQVSLPIIYRKVDTRSDAKANRIKGLEILLNDDRLWFVAGSWIDETVLQFLRYTGERRNRGRKDDIPDAVSLLQLFLPNAVTTTAEESAEIKQAREEEQRKALEKAFHDSMFNPVPSKQPPIFIQDNRADRYVIGGSR